MFNYTSPGISGTFICERCQLVARPMENIEVLGGRICMVQEIRECDSFIDSVLAAPDMSVIVS